MGCGIHLYREKYVNGHWESCDEWEPYDYGGDEKGFHVDYDKRVFTDRNYQLFGILAEGVRSKHKFSFKQRGVPLTLSPQVNAEIKQWSGDGHSHSYLYLRELKDLKQFLEAETIHIEGMKNREELRDLQESIASGNPDWRLLFPFCAWTNAEKHDHFELDVPASFYVGKSLDKIIQSFNGIEADDHRIVFFFDN